MARPLTADRYRARPELRITIDAQGHRRDQLAAQLGMLPPQLTRIVNRYRTINVADAERLATLLNAHFDVLFESPHGEFVTNFGERSAGNGE